MTEGDGGNGRRNGGNGASSSEHPAVVGLHATLDAIEKMLHGDEPMCDFAAVEVEIDKVSVREGPLRASILEIAQSGLLRRRRSRRPAAR